MPSSQQPSTLDEDQDEEDSEEVAVAHTHDSESPSSSSTTIVSPPTTTTHHTPAPVSPHHHHQHHAVVQVAHVHLPPPPTHLTRRTTSGGLAELSRALSLEISRYGGDDIHDPPLALPPPSLLRRGSERGSGVGRGEGGGGGGGEGKPAERDSNLVDWDGPDDPCNPLNWSKTWKWCVTGIVILLCLNVTFASSAPSSLSDEFGREFGVSREVSDLVTTLFLVGYCFGPLVWGPGSEVVGRKPIFVLAMAAYTAFQLGQALAPNIQTLLVTRFFSGFFACAPLTNSGGTIADIWDAEGRGLAVTLFGASVFLGPVLGPIVSGFIAQSPATWRWIFWVMIIFAGSCALTTLALPETYTPVLLSRKAKRLRKKDPSINKDLYAEHEKQDWSFKGVLKRTVVRPFRMLALEPILMLVTVYMSVIYGLLYALFQAIPLIFAETKGFNMAQSGLVFVGVGIGTTLGCAMYIWTCRDYGALVSTWKGFPPPERRLYSSLIGSPVLIVGTFWLGWTGRYAAVPWYVPALSTVLVGAGIANIFMSFQAYLIDTYLMYSASALAANTVVRSGVAAAFPLFTVQMFHNLGINWACSLVGFILILFAPAPFFFYKYGARVRKRSKFAPCIDLRIAKELEEEGKLEKSGP